MPRNKTYDEDLVLEKAMNVFWEHGYEATSVRLLEKEMGINQFSIYSSFKNKKNLFISAIRKYRQYVIQNRFLPLLEKDAGFTELEKFLISAAIDSNFASEKKGCLVVNTAGEVGEKDSEIAHEVNLYYDFIRITLRKVLKNAVLKKEIRGNTDIEAQANFFLGVMQGISIAGKTMDESQFTDFIDVALKQLK